MSIEERKLTGGEKRSKEAKFKNLKSTKVTLRIAMAKMMNQ